MLEAFLTLIPVFVTPLFVLYVVGTFTRVHRRSGIIGLLVGAGYGVVALYDREYDAIDWLSPSVTGRWEAFIWSTVVTAVTMFLVTCVLGRDDGRRRSSGASENSNWVDRSRESLGPVREHPFQGTVPRLLRPGWIAVALLAAASYSVFVFLW